jgi:hypothetical protein
VGVYTPGGFEQYFLAVQAAATVAGRRHGRRLAVARGGRPAVGAVRDLGQLGGVITRARTASMVSASAGVLSGRYRTTRAKRSATPPG